MPIVTPSSVIFDVDGLLVNTESSATELKLSVSKELNLNLSREFLSQHTAGRIIDKNLLPIINKYQADHHLPCMTIKQLKKFRKILSEKRQKSFSKHHVSFMPGALAILAFLKNQSIPLGIGTASCSTKTPLKLGGPNYQKTKNNCLNFFDAITTRDDVETGKPNPETFLRSFHLLKEKHPKIELETTLVIGDSLFDIEGANKAGMQSALVQKSKKRFKAIKTTQEPDIATENLAELMGILAFQARR